MHAYASAEATGDASTPNAVSECFFQDTLTVSSSQLQPGALVQLRFTMDLNDSFLTNNSEDSLQVYAGFSNAGSYLRFANMPAPPSVVQSTITIPVGEQFGIDGDLESISTPEASYQVSGDDSYATADATANFYVDSLSRGVTITSASGHNYSMPATTAVPEVSGDATLLVGLLLSSTLSYRRFIVKTNA